METWIVADAAGNGSSLDWKLILSIFIPGVIVVIGWFTAHWLTSLREFKSRRREARVKGLEAAYMKVATSSNREMTEEIMDALETFVTEIQLYGTPRQVQLTGQMVQDFVAKKSPVPYDPILVDLRDVLRKELQLEPLKDNVWWLRFERPTATKKTVPGASTSTRAAPNSDDQSG